MDDEELRRLFAEVRQELAGMRQENAAAHAETRQRFEQLETRFDETTGRFDKRFDENDARFDENDARFDAIDARFDEVEARFVKQLEEHSVEIRRHFDVSLENMVTRIAAGNESIRILDEALTERIDETDRRVDSLDDDVADLKVRVDRIDKPH